MKKFYLLVHTIRYLTPKQFVYQVYYKFKSCLLPFFNYNRYLKDELYAVVVETGRLIVSKQKYIGTITFTFLNLTKKFDEQIDWNFEGYGKLWNYNLQYFDYLHDDGLSDNEKQRLIEDFSNQLLGKKIRPEPYPVSLRLFNWILYYSQTGYTSPAFEKTLKYQVDYLENNLEYHILANHLLENYFALLVCGFVLRNQRLTIKSFKCIEDELEEQVLNDGGHYECSPMYHIILLSKLLLILNVLSKNKWIDLDDTILRHKAEKMLSWLFSFSFKDGSFAHFNDSINGIVPHTYYLFNYARGLGLKIERAQLKESGYRMFTFGNYEMIVDVGNIIPTYQPGHAHSDMLSFCLNVKNRPFITDVGISTYEKNDIRQWERSTFSHNTVTIKNQSQSDVWSGFRIGKRAEVFLLEDEAYKLRARHNGYKEKYNCMHEREFSFSEKIIIISDYLTDTSLIGTAFFYFDHSILKPVKRGDKYIFDKVGSLQLSNSSLKEDILTYEQPVGYNKREKSFYLKVEFKNFLITTIQLYN